MTLKQSTTRLILYVAFAGVSAASAGVTAVDWTQPPQVAAFALGIIGAVIAAWRSYIDQSPSQIGMTMTRKDENDPTP